MSVGDPRGSPAAGECFSNASIANTIRAGDREVDDRAEGQDINFSVARTDHISNEASLKHSPAAGDPRGSPTTIHPN